MGPAARNLHHVADRKFLRTKQAVCRKQAADNRQKSAKTPFRIPSCVRSRENHAKFDPGGLSLRPSAQKVSPRSPKLSPRRFQRLFFSTFGHFFSEFLDLFDFFDEFLSPRRAQEWPKSTPRAPRRAQSAPKRPPKPVLGGLSETFWKLREGFERQHDKNMRIELSCRRELNPEGSKGNQNQSNITLN